ncbi:MAG: protein translocase subunit SecD [Planctomycetaceae bacterium]|nr:protein translocase subunit SecD [Planctomycetaceae bacterium]
MDKNVVRFGFLAVLILTIFAAVNLWPPDEKLKPGLDLAGGTSLIYEIDTTGLAGSETDNLAQKLAPILMKRIDPGNVQNIIMRPQGDTRIEIQVPLASADTHRRREAYDTALADIMQGNINLAVIKRALTKDAAERETLFAQYAGDSNDRKTILESLATSHDAKRAAQEKRDAFVKQLNDISENLTKSGVAVDTLASLASQDANAQQTSIDGLVANISSDKAKKARGQIEQYINIQKQWAQVVNLLTAPETGLNAVYRAAETNLSNFNLNTETLTAVLDMPERSSKRAEMISQFKSRFPARVEKIDALVSAFTNYRSVRGRIDGPDDVKRMLKGAGVLEFRILPKDGDGRTNKDELNSYVEALKTKGSKLASDSKYVWIEIENPKDGTWQGGGLVIGTFGEKAYVLTSNQKNECMLKHTGTKPWKLTRSRPTIDQMGKRAIDFSFDEVGGSIFYNITHNNLQRPLCIILDNMALSAPNIRSEIRNNGIIEGNYSQTEQMDMVDKLNAGSLPARLIEPPISEKTIGPSIGADNRDAGIKSGLIGLGVVMVFMIVYYTVAGCVAGVALALNILFLLAIMALSKATFTLSGIAGVVLTIGMAVDANVLIYERIREEKNKGASLRLSITNGYKRAFSVIFDSNVTSILTAMILYLVASEEIKGFAITLILGLVSSMFTSLFVTRIIFQWLLNVGIIRDHMVMLQIIKSPKINWMKLRPAMLTVSAILVIGGLFMFFTRDDSKNNKYDIEFTGGTSVQIDLKPEFAMDRAGVEQAIRLEGEKIGNSAIAAAKVYSIVGQQTTLQYEITTTETNKASVTITFKDSSNTITSITEAVKATQKKMRGLMTNLVVKATDDPAKFVLTTSQTNKQIINNILSKAFGDKVEISTPELAETVTSAVIDAFHGKLQLLENLNPTIVSTESITNDVVDKIPELGDYLDGIKIEFKVDRPVTLDEMNNRFTSLRDKPDMKDIAWFKYQITGPDFAADSNKPMTDFVYVSVPQDAGYRQLAEGEWASFAANEKTKVTAAAELKTSLSRVTQFAPSIGSESRTRAVMAIVLSLIAMMAYLWIRFGDLRYGLGAIVSLAHDVCIALGFIMFSAFLSTTFIGQKLLVADFKIDLAIVAALLTLVGYSVNDTIVVFDRIRENKGKLSILTDELINDSINQTLSRTILTSFTTFLVVIIMYIFGGSGFRGFNYVMTIGIVVGTYSSIAIAAPLLVLGHKVAKAKRHN